MTCLEDLGVAFGFSYFFGPEFLNCGLHEFVPKLPQLRSVSFTALGRYDLVEVDFEFFMKMGPVENLYIDTTTSSCSLKPLSWQGKSIAGNVTSLVLTSTRFYPSELEAVLRSCAPLSTFKWIVNDKQAATCVLSWQVVSTLRIVHGATLRTLCLKFLSVSDRSQFGRISTGPPIGSLWGFDALESLWIDLDAVAGGTERRSGASQPANFHTLPWIIGHPQHFVQTLPGTLKRVFFYVPHRTSGWDDSVVWLGRAGDRFPSLTDIRYYNAFRGCTFRMVRRRPYRCPFVPALQWD
ncbi:hypothetical protein CGCTS75_v000421 [Colletotrichum tropicale]|nr:hypothetical protein CGCTS75_v000421 [Colletotrichum tropicale]